MATTKTMLKRKSPPAKTPARALSSSAVELTPRGKAELADSRRATDAELTQNLHASAKAYNRDLAAAAKAGLVILGTLATAPATNSNDDAEASSAQTMDNVIPPLVLLSHIGRKYL